MLPPGVQKLLRFKLIKKRNEYFVLDNFASLNFKNGSYLSNSVRVISVAKKSNKIFCDSPFWRV